MKLQPLLTKKLFWLAVVCATAGIAIFGWRQLAGAGASRTGTSRISSGNSMAQSSFQPLRSPSVDKSEASVAAPPFAEKLSASLQRIGRETDPGKRASQLTDLANEIRVADISGVLDFLHGQPGEFRSDLAIPLISRWAHADSAAAADWVQGNLTGSVRQSASENVGATWAGKDFQSAADWARRLPGTDEQNSVMLTIAYEVNRTDPLAALGLATELPPGPARDDFVIHAATAWTASAPEKAIEWARQLPDEDFRQRTLAGIAAAWAETDPVAAATFAVQSLPAGKDQNDAVIGVLQRWVQKEPEHAAAWALAFPEGGLRETALEAVVKLWADKDLAEVGNWVNGVSFGAKDDAAVAAYVEKVAVQYPEMAAEWAKEIRSEPLRDQQMENLAELWLRHDATAARAWITQAPLPETTKSRLLAPRP